MEDRTYFERLEAERTRYTELRMLDQALRERTEHIAPHGMRLVIGRWMMLMGARLAGEQLPTSARTCH